MKTNSGITAFFLTGAIIMTGLFQNCSGGAGGEAVRAPAVAGQFYPADPAELKRDVDKYIEAGMPKTPFAVAPRIIISPHAGYEFSGPVAGFGYAAIDRNVRTVIVLGPPHHVPVQGIATAGAAWFLTPLGKVKVDQARITKTVPEPDSLRRPGAPTLPSTASRSSSRFLWSGSVLLKSCPCS